MAAEGRNDITLGVLEKLPTNNARKITALSNREALAIFNESKFNLVDDTTDVIETNDPGIFLTEVIDDLQTQMTTAEGDIDDLESDVSTLIANTTPGVWIAPTLDGDWEDYDIVNLNSTAFRRVGGQIHLRGAVEGGLDGSLVFTLPAFFRPLKLIVLPIITITGELANISIQTDGDIFVNFSGISAISLDGAFFWTS